MKILGIWLLVIGAAIAVGSLLLPTTAPVEVPSGSLYGLPTRSNVYNLGLLQQQMMVFVTGCALAVLGGALVAIGHLGERVSRLTSETNAPEQSAAPSTSSAAPSDVRTSDDFAGRADNEVGWVIGITAAALLFAFFAVLFGQLSSNSTSPAANVTDMNVTDEVLDNMTPVDAGALASPVAAPTPKSAEAPEAAPGTDDSEIGRDNWEGD